MNTATTEEPLRPHPAVETAFLPPEVVLWDGRLHQVHHFNPSASAVWLCIDGELTAGQIAAELSDIFEMPEEVIRPDVDEAIVEFVRLGLLNGDVASAGSEDPARDRSHGKDMAVLARPPDR